MDLSAIKPEQTSVYAIVTKDFAVYGIPNTFNTLEEAQAVLERSYYKDEYRVIEIKLPTQ